MVLQVRVVLVAAPAIATLFTKAIHVNSVLMVIL